MSKNYYSEMLDILKDDFPVNRNAVYGWMIIHCPHSIIQATKATSQTLSQKFKEQSYIEECRALLRNDKYIESIKHLKERTGMGLKEAKEAINKLLEEMNL